MAKRQNFVVGSTNPVTATKTQAQLNNGWNKYEVLKAGDLDGVFNAVSDYSKDSSNEIANAILEITGSQPTGASDDELAGALRQMREDIETTSLTFKGYISATQPSASDYAFQVGNIWIQSATLPTSFPVAIAGVWDGTQWASTTDTYTQKDFDFFRNVNDNEGYYWFGGEWVVMSTDMSTTYFTLNQTSGKWEIKTSVNLPGQPTAATPTASSPQNQIANKEYVDNAIGGSGTGRNVGDIFFTTRKDNTLNGAVECNGDLYVTTDFTQSQSIGDLLEAGKLPYVSLSQYATLLSTNGSVGVFGWDGAGTTQFRVPSLNDIFVETGTAAQIGDYLPAGMPNITGQFWNGGRDAGANGAFWTTAAQTNQNRDYLGDQGAKTFNFDASRSSSVYGNSNTVQPNAVRYRAMIQLAISASDQALMICTGVTSDVANLKTHSVIEFQAPTSQNNYTWYRKYADGWVEQGGKITANDGTNTAVDFLIAMADTNYCFYSGQMSYNQGSEQYVNGWALTTYSTTGFTVHSATNGTNIFSWEVKGMAQG